MDRVFFIKSECNDRGWITGYYYYKKVEDAITSMRRYVAHKIIYERSQGNKVDLLKFWRDSAIGSLGKVKTISITFKVINKDGEVFFWDFRVDCADLLDGPLDVDKCFNF